eukprot:CAMPEP_0182526696 /NCGR_PEP_ID=MMETSP1323-20130603/3378_1 /TAXON_ID=236787 /ORGANISM="Florenciella parvula, Strain RCC1693" /LENGTH=85 /DNA_ID=CAMNT_0024735595 /DNA_START=287 /DNA_END=547 /DNA_ORIENTATION=-
MGASDDADQSRCCRHRSAHVRTTYQAAPSIEIGETAPTMVGASAGGLSLTVGTLGWSAYPPVRAQEPALGLGGGVGVPAPVVEQG